MGTAAGVRGLDKTFHDSVDLQECQFSGNLSWLSGKLSWLKVVSFLLAVQKPDKWNVIRPQPVVGSNIENVTVALIAYVYVYYSGCCK